MKKRPKTTAEKEESKRIRADRMKMCGYVCEWCKEKPATDEHHVFGRKSEYIETVICLCSYCHRGGGYQARLNQMKIDVTTELIEKYGEDKARLMSGGRFYFKQDEF